jgi:SSS family solute:Na+ symporter
VPEEVSSARTPGIPPENAERRLSGGDARGEQATFIIGMFWRRMTAAAGFWSLLSGTLGALATYLLYKGGVVHFDSDLEESFWGAGIAFVAVAVVAAAVTLVTTPKRTEDLHGLVYGMTDAGLADDSLAGDAAWYRSPVLLGSIAVVLAVLFYISLW